MYVRIIYIYICNTVTPVTPNIKSRAQEFLTEWIHSIFFESQFSLLIPVLRCYRCYNVDYKHLKGVTVGVTQVLQRCFSVKIWNRKARTLLKRGV